MTKKIVLIGGGGHCKSVLDSLLHSHQYADIGIIDKKIKIGTEILGVPVLGDDEALPELLQKGFTEAFITLGSIGLPAIRIRLFHHIQLIGFNTPNVVDSSATVSAHVHLGQGIFIGKDATVNAGAQVHTGAIINTAATIEHDCVIGEFAHVAPGALLCGEVVIGAGSHIGASSVVKQGVKIGTNAIIGMGSVVLRDIDDDVIAYGNPCKEVRRK